MYSVAVSDHFMIAHSFKGAVFGPAQALHGATYGVEVELRRPSLDADGIVVDIGAFGDLLKAVLRPFNFTNLDDNKDFSGRNTTTEFMAKVVFDAMAARIAAGDLGADAAKGLAAMKVTLRESPTAWAAYEGALAPA
jgi:6-pyruvoyl-tetrahydropterin synthase